MSALILDFCEVRPKGEPPLGALRRRSDPATGREWFECRQGVRGEWIGPFPTEAEARTLIARGEG